MAVVVWAVCAALAVGHLVAASEAIGVSASPSSDDDVLEGLATDDACQAGGEGCSVELVQLRAHRKALESDTVEPLPEPAEVAANGNEPIAAASSREGEVPRFGWDTQGENMWDELTWEGVLAQFGANASTGIPGNDDDKDEPRSDGAPPQDDGDNCPTDTYGTCTVTHCAFTRGPTTCDRGKCMCKPGHCAFAGVCYPKRATECLADTGGACHIGWCRGWRGETACEDGRCMCKKGGCVWAGRCLPVTETGGTCGVVPCRPSRGPTTCHRGRCLCQRGYVASNGRCDKMSWL